MDETQRREGKEEEGGRGSAKGREGSHRVRAGGVGEARSPQGRMGAGQGKKKRGGEGGRGSAKGREGSHKS